MSKNNAETFRQNPERYMPGMGGYCPNSMRARHVWMIVGNPEDTLYIDGMWYVFGRPDGPGIFAAVTAETRTLWIKQGWAFYRQQAGQ